MSENAAPEARTGPETVLVLSEKVKLACDIATGRAPANPDDEGRGIAGAKKDLNCKGKGPEWYRMVWRSGSWRYVSDDRLPSGKFLASDRRCTVYGEVYPGEITAQHDRGSAIDTVWLQTGEEGIKCDFKKRRDGNLAVTLPDGTDIVLPDPRKK